VFLHTNDFFASFAPWREKKEKYKPRVNNVLLSNIGTVGKSLVIKIEQDFIIAWNVFILKLNKKVLPDYLKICLDRFDAENYWLQFMTGGTVKFINKKTISVTEISLPPLEIQKQIVAQIEAEQKIVDANKKLAEIFENKIKATISGIWAK
jgi:type I restriction enzyme S subunit